jgi:hypothetical protein
MARAIADISAPSRYRCGRGDPLGDAGSAGLQSLSCPIRASSYHIILQVAPHNESGNTSHEARYGSHRYFDLTKCQLESVRERTLPEKPPPNFVSCEALSLLAR